MICNNIKETDASFYLTMMQGVKLILNNCLKMICHLGWMNFSNNILCFVREPHEYKTDWQYLAIQEFIK